MSEELIQLSPKPLGRYSYYKIGATTLSQLKKSGVIKCSIQKQISNKKPDGLIVMTGGKVKAVVEYKQPSELRTKAQINKAIKQELDVAKALCKILIVTDGKKTFWVNALNGNMVLGENGKEIKSVFNTKPIEAGNIKRELVLKLESLLDKLDHSLSKTNDRAFSPEVLDPTQLAKTIWQKIWINTGKEPEKCLYNVVELFVFKFLSDVGVLRSHNNFSSVYQISQSETPEDAIKHYANTCRREIKELFPKGKDGTTIINGTIFVNEQGEPNTAQSSLFSQVLEDLQDYDHQYGSFKYIKKEFKTRLYETFLRQSAGIKALGQYFTPRNVVSAIVGMSDASKLKKGARVCDPFCGVGGFLLELISENPNILKEFEPTNGKVKPKISIIGYDKGSDEKDDERTIILAKANMLIYFSDLLVKYNTKNHLKAFSEGAFNKVFNLIRTNLGTFGKIDDEGFDLILTNPPYVTSGSSTIKKQLDENGLSSHYTLGGRGTESLSVEWIVEKLKPDGQAIVVVPDGLLNQSIVMSYLTENCIIEAIVSLPIRTFYSTPKKTYILSLRKKSDVSIEQEEPIFTYLVSEIGESRDANRWEIEDNDLKEMVTSFRQFSASPAHFCSSSTRCKVLAYNSLKNLSSWMVDRFWSEEDKINFGIKEASTEISLDEFRSIIESHKKWINNLDDLPISTRRCTVKNISLGDGSYFELSIGTRILKKNQLQAGIPAYSANVKTPFGYIEESNLKKFEEPSLIWGIDGIYDWGYIEKNIPFATTDHCGRLQIKNKKIHPKYIYYKLKSDRNSYGFDRTHRASLKNTANFVTIDIPIDSSGEFDLETQISYAENYEAIEKLRSEFLSQLESLTRSEIDITTIK